MCTMYIQVIVYTTSGGFFANFLVGERVWCRIETKIKHYSAFLSRMGHYLCIVSCSRLASWPHTWSWTLLQWAICSWPRPSWGSPTVQTTRSTPGHSRPSSQSWNSSWNWTHALWNPKLLFSLHNIFWDYADSISIQGSTISNSTKYSNQPRNISKRNSSEDAQISEHFSEF